MTFLEKLDVETEPQSTIFKKSVHLTSLIFPVDSVLLYSWKIRDIHILKVDSRCQIFMRTTIHYAMKALWHHLLWSFHHSTVLYCTVYTTGVINQSYIFLSTLIFNWISFGVLITSNSMQWFKSAIFAILKVPFLNRSMKFNLFLWPNVFFWRTMEVPFIDFFHISRVYVSQSMWIFSLGHPIHFFCFKHITIDF